MIISLGSSCDTANKLKRIGINQPTFFFDYVWNELDGLKNVNNMIMNDFNHFDDINNYIKTKEHPILNWGEFNINKYYPTFCFMHHDTGNQNVIDSLIRKIDRTKHVLSSNHYKTFIYYRHYNCDLIKCTDLKVITEECIDFCNIYKNKYNYNFSLLALITYDINEDINILHSVLYIDEMMKML